MSNFHAAPQCELTSLKWLISNEIMRARQRPGARTGKTVPLRRKRFDSIPSGIVWKWHPAAVLTTLDHVVLAVRDLPAAAGATARLLGRSPGWTGEHPGAGTANVLFRLENTYLELLAPAGAGPLAEILERHLAARGDGLFALALGTPDAEACHETLESKGLQPGAPASGLGRDTESGAFRKWRSVLLPAERTRGLHLFAIEHLSSPDLLPLTPPLGTAGAAPHALDHVVVRSADVEASRQLFGDALGIRLALDRSFEAFDMRALFFRIGGVTIEVGGSLSAPRDPAAPDALWGLAWKVGDAEAARERLAAAGLDVSPVREGRKPGTRVCTVRSGTCGVPTLLIGPAPASG
jgi:catechol 2,3-dioxygenase-like lactoylglutathione lyase family enzyme